MSDLIGQLIAKLVAALGEDTVLVGGDVTSRSAGWGLTEPNAAAAVVRPRTTDQVATTLRLCHEASQTVCVQGGMTGLVHGNVARAGEIALSLERMNKIEEIDELGRTMTVQAGVPLQTIQEKAYEVGLMFPLDLGARGSCQIGGNVATNAGGNRVIRYGMTRDLVLGLEAVLADGTVISSMFKMVKNNSGYDLKQLFIGSEGTLGIVTRVVLRLVRQPRSHNIALVSIASFDKVTGFLRAAQDRLGADLSAFEVMWDDFYWLVTSPPAKSLPPLPHGSPFYVLVEALGAHQEEDGERFERVLGACLEEELIEDAVLGRSRAERDKLWEIRDDVEQMGRMGPIFTYDIGLAIGDMEAYVAEVRGRIGQRWPDARIVVFGHLGDGNLHVVVGVGDGSREARRAVEAIVYGALESRGGTVSAEHGIGFEKRPYLKLTRSDAELALMRTLKQALDPRGILNPGRVLEPA